jgi:hypothetical protein
MGTGADRELSEPVACTLNGTDLKAQRERWINLGENFGIARRETTDGLRLTFEDHPAVEAELRALADAENGCCSWAAWSAERDAGGTLVMVARSQGGGIATLHGMFTAGAFRGYRVEGGAGAQSWHAPRRTTSWPATE